MPQSVDIPSDNYSLQQQDREDLHPLRFSHIDDTGTETVFESPAGISFGHTTEQCKPTHRIRYTACSTASE